MSAPGRVGRGVRSRARRGPVPAVARRLPRDRDRPLGRAARGRRPRRLWHGELGLPQQLPVDLADKAGIQAALWGTIWLMGVCAALHRARRRRHRDLPRGVRGRERWWNRLIEVNIQNLAAVPVDRLRDPRPRVPRARAARRSGNVVLAGGLTLGLLVLPMVIIAGREAIRAVPPSIREGSLALGATQWQTIWRQVLPAAVPGIATGVILALSRAIGETAPLIVVGAATLSRSTPRASTRVHRAADPDLRLDLARLQRCQRVPAACGRGNPAC